jgi:hypothetical protein
MVNRATLVGAPAAQRHEIRLVGGGAIFFRTHALSPSMKRPPSTRLCVSALFETHYKQIDNRFSAQHVLC